MRRTAVVTGGTAAGLHVLRKMVHAQTGAKLCVWLFKSFVTDGNEILARRIEAWAKERKVQVEMDWATFGDFLASATPITYLVPPSILFIPLYKQMQGLGMANSLTGLIAAYPSFTVPFVTWLLMGYFESTR